MKIEWKINYNDYHNIHKSKFPYVNFAERAQCDFSLKMPKKRHFYLLLRVGSLKSILTTTITYTYTNKPKKHSQMVMRWPFLCKYWKTIFFLSREVEAISCCCCCCCWAQSCDDQASIETRTLYSGWFQNHPITHTQNTFIQSIWIDAAFFCLLFSNVHFPVDFFFVKWLSRVNNSFWVSCTHV